MARSNNEKAATLYKFACEKDARKKPFSFQSPPLLLFAECSALSVARQEKAGPIIFRLIGLLMDLNLSHSECTINKIGRIN